MIPLIQYGLGIYSNKVMLRYKNSDKGREIRKHITSVTQFREFILARCKKHKVSPASLIIMCSSSMDFPEESTNNKKVIALAHALR